MSVKSFQVDFLHEKGFLAAEHKDTYMDEACESLCLCLSREAIGWSIAALGFMTQLAMGQNSQCVLVVFNCFSCFGGR